MTQVVHFRNISRHMCSVNLKLTYTKNNSKPIKLIVWCICCLVKKYELPLYVWIELVIQQTIPQLFYFPLKNRDENFLLSADMYQFGSLFYSEKFIQYWPSKANIISQLSGNSRISNLLRLFRLSPKQHEQQDIIDVQCKHFVSEFCNMRPLFLPIANSQYPGLGHTMPTFCRNFASTIVGIPS